MLDITEGDALAGLLGEVEDVAGTSSAASIRHGVDCRPPIAEVVESYVYADGKCKAD